MTCKFFVALAAIFFLLIEKGHALSLEEYRQKVHESSLKSKQLQQESTAAGLEARSADLIFTPSFFANAQVIQDKALSNPPLLTYDRYDSSQYSLGFQQQFSFGLQAKLSYQITKTNYINSPLSATTNLNYVDAKPILELTLPIWKNGFGRSAQAREEAVRAQSAAQYDTSQSEMTQLEIQLESLYWRAAAAKESVDVQTQSLKSAEGVKEYVSRKARMDLGENSDVIQASALVEARKLQLLQAENDARSVSQDLHALMNENSNEIPATMDRIDSEKVLALTLPTKRPGKRSDVQASEEQTRAAKANAIMSAEDVKPSLDLYGSYAMNGRGDDPAAANQNISSANRDSKVIGLRFSMPLNLGAESDVIKASRLRSQAAETSYQRILFEQDVAWSDLIRKLDETKQNLKLATTVEQIQNRKLTMEKKRLREGRTTTYQVLLFEQDYLDAQLGRVRNAAQILSLKSQAKAYDVTATEKNNEQSNRQPRSALEGK